MSDLFGGAISADIPSTFIDASDFRPIPSHQEVYVSKDSSDSIIIEIVEMQPVPIEIMAEYHLKEVCDSLSNVVIENGISNQIGAVGAMGYGRIQDQMIHMIVLRLEKQATDLLISWNSTDNRASELKDLTSTLIVRDFSLFS
jgi:hypothetical protein